MMSVHFLKQMFRFGTEFFLYDLIQAEDQVENLTKELEATKVIVRQNEELAIRLNEELEHVNRNSFLIKIHVLFSFVFDFRFEKPLETRAMNFNKHKKCFTIINK